MENKKSNPLKTMLIYGMIILLAVLLIWWFVNKNSTDQKISYDQFQTYVQEDKIDSIDIYGYTIRIRLVDSKINEKDFPNKKIDHYCTYYGSYDRVYDLLDKHNYKTDENGNLIIINGAYQLREDVHFIKVNAAPKSESWLTTAMPYISILIIAVIAFLLFRSMSGSKNGFGFGRSKARLVESSNVHFSDVAGAEEEKQELQEIVEFLKNPTRFTELGARIPKGVLLVGQPGTGKTLLAKAVAGEGKVPFFTISGSDFVELYVGVGASRVRDLFETAKAHAPCIVFIDEIDAVGRQRGAGLGGGNDEREQTLNQLLVEMDGFEANSGIIVLAATNRADILDPALTRPGRFDRQIYVHLPDVKGREDIIKVHSKNKPLSPDVDIKRLARLTSGLAGADIENVLNEAALLTARDGRYKISMIDLQEALNKVLMGPKKVSRVITEQDKKITAVHEAGHAIVAQSLENCDNVQEISVIPRGEAGGYTLTLDENDRTHMQKQKLNDTICMMLGGRTAEEIMLDDITTGASNDIERATKVARKMVAEWGMSDKLGLLSFGEGDEIFVGRDYQKQVPYSQELASTIDKEVAKIINTAHERAKEILTSKKDVIEKVQRILLEKETIYKEEFEMIYNGATVEEVEKAIDEKEKEKREYQERAKKEAIEEHKTRDIKSRVETAQALAKAGVISKQDLEAIISEAEKEMASVKGLEIKQDEQNITENKEATEKTKEQPQTNEEHSKKKTTNKKTKKEDDKN